MGIAAYNRGCREIARQFCHDRRCPGCINCREHVPTPRPDGWGDKTKQRALDHARCVLSGAARAGLPLPSEETLADVVRERARVGKATAHEAARRALG